ncbi:hypothetical protein [Tumebacillus flagellatus]|uniref:Uncharacterized protein n=1 Tax=Tumebacillus flagellatus TaxID=1157490 RepID=A0A074LUC4_9BACL|nr:hypothetical protein [Tumebacillus flagellatus]KEO84170.1 hypothetical protein EL26_05225 [Tumebacillus flagellatus]
MHPRGKLHESELYVEPLPEEESRSPFNSVLAHADAVAGFRTAKHGGQVKKWYRLYAWFSLLVFVGSILWTTVKQFRSM